MLEKTTTIYGVKLIVSVLSFCHRLVLFDWISLWIWIRRFQTYDLPLINGLEHFVQKANEKESELNVIF